MATPQRSDGPPERLVERTVEEDGTIVEPGSGTVDDWRSQDIERDKQAAEEALAKAGGNPDKAEELFEQDRPPHKGDRYDVPAEDRPGGTSTAG